MLPTIKCENGVIDVKKILIGIFLIIVTIFLSGTCNAAATKSDNNNEPPVLTIKVKIDGTMSFTAPIKVEGGIKINPKEGEDITFDCSSSYDPDGDHLTYYLDLGDGTYSYNSTTVHQYSKGTFTVNVTISDGKSNESMELYVIVESPKIERHEEDHDNSIVSWILILLVVALGAVLGIIIISKFKSARPSRPQHTLGYIESDKTKQVVSKAKPKRKIVTEKRQIIIPEVQPKQDPIQERIITDVREKNHDKWVLAEILWSSEIYKKFDPDLRKIGDAGMKDAFYNMPTKKLNAFCKEIWNNRTYISKKNPRFIDETRRNN